jgi:hypothetical protein
MNSDQISKMFLIAEQFGFWVCQPAFADSGKISHQITRQQTKDCIRIVNFVEVTCPLFQRDKLEAFMRVYDGSLTGWGIDFWFANILDARRRARFAVVDRVVVVNRKDEDKPGRFREIDLLQPARERQSQWTHSGIATGLSNGPTKRSGQSTRASLSGPDQRSGRSG